MSPTFDLDGKPICNTRGEPFDGVCFSDVLDVPAAGFIIPPEYVPVLQEAIARGGIQWRIDVTSGECVGSRFLDEIKSLDDPWPDEPIQVQRLDP